MSKQTYTWELNSEEQDDLWINDTCPRCKRKILDRNTNEDIAIWRCYGCDTEFVAE